MTKKEFLELKNKHSYENQYKVKNKKELEELVKLAESVDVHMDLNWLDVSNIRSMSNLFAGSKFNGDISKWDVSNVRDMSSMFMGSAFNGDISKWNVSKVKNMFSMFQSSVFNGDISKWDVSNVGNMYCMFRNSRFRGYLGKWNVSNVKDMDYMFENSGFKGYLGKWNVSKVKDATKFNNYLNITSKDDLNNYISFLKATHEDKPLNIPIKKEWFKTDGIHLYIADRMNRDKEFTENIKKALCSRKY